MADLATEEPIAYLDFTSRCHVCGVLVEHEGGQRVDSRCDHVLGVMYDLVPTEEDVDRLLDMPDYDFEQIVAQDARGAIPQMTAAALRDDDVLDRWDEALTSLVQQVQAQLAARKGDREVRGWRGAAMRFQAGLLARKKECRTRIKERNVEWEAARTKGNRAAKRESKRERKLAAAAPKERAITRLIEAHRDEFTAMLVEEHEAAGLPIRDSWLPSPSPAESAVDSEE